MVKKKKAVKKKPAKKKEPESVAIGLHNVFQFLVKETEAQSKVMADLNRKLDRLQLTVDAVGIKVAEMEIEL
jgi:hypothetical protein